jgi:hypothetical protein
MTTKLRLRVTPSFLASFFNGLGTSVRIDGLARYVDLDYTGLQELTSGIDSSNSLVAIYNKATLTWNVTSLATVLNASQTIQVITGVADVNVAAADGLIVMNRTVGAASNVNLPLSSTKIGKVKVSDFKVDSGANAITVNTTGADRFPGGGTTWKINANGASAVFDPIPGIGYAV